MTLDWQPEEIAAMIAETGNSLRSLVKLHGGTDSEYEKLRKRVYLSEDVPNLRDLQKQYFNNTHPAPRVAELQLATMNGVEPPPSALKVHKMVSEDLATWGAYKEKLKMLGRWARLAFWTDAHLPYQSNEAIEVAAQVTEDFNPDLVTTLNDALDYPEKSRFPGQLDAWQVVWHSDEERPLEAMRQYTSIQKDAAPNALLLALIGNHDLRFFLEMMRLMGGSPWIVAHYIERMRAMGMLWINTVGAKSDEETIDLNDSLKITHGHYAVKETYSTVKKHVDEYMQRYSVIHGHIHRPAWLNYEVPEGQHDIEAMSVPCLCGLHPHYSKRYQRGWQNGLGLAYYNPDGHGVSMDVVKFRTEQGYMVARWGGKEYRQKIYTGNSIVKGW